MLQRLSRGLSCFDAVCSRPGTARGGARIVAMAAACAAAAWAAQPAPGGVAAGEKPASAETRASGGAAPPAAGQAQPGQGAAGAAGGDQTRQLRLEDLPPPIRLGARAESMRRAWATWPTVVIVEDEASYVEAVGRWTLRARYPVLIDDGTLLAREDIARFVRAFEPQRVVRWSTGEGGGAAGGEGTGRAEVGTDAARALPGSRQERQRLIESAALRVWRGAMAEGEGEGEGGGGGARDFESFAAMVSRLRAVGLPPPGVVVADPDDGAWPAALALSAGRGQPIVWIGAEQGAVQGVNGALSRAQFDTLNAAVRAGVDGLGLTFSRIGDEVDAVTLCTHAPIRVQASEQDVFATTDLLCRDAPAGAAVQGVERWAWAGQIFGTPSQAAYRAMCALFLGIDSAWLFDGYPDSAPWNQYDASQAAQLLRQGAFARVDVLDTPRQSDRAWRGATMFGIDAGLVAVNTKGNADEFNLEPGQCRPGDVPFLRRPAVVYFVHSFSAAAPESRATVAGRWLERGAYAYLGSVYEPFLQAFVPTPKLAGRLLASYPWAVAVRPDSGPAWRLAVIGDPLVAVGPPPPRVPAETPAESFPLADARDVAEAARAHVASREFERAIAALTLLGRDEDAARLAAAIMKDDAAALTTGAAAAAILPLHRARRGDELARAYSLLPKDTAADPVLRDALWHATSHEAGAEKPRLLSTLRVNLRDDQAGRDAAEIAGAVARAFSSETALGMLAEARTRSGTEYDRNAVDEASKRLGVRTPAGK